MKKKASHTWRSIIKVRDFVMKNIKWIIGNGKDISFWHDWWCGDKALDNSDHDILNENVKVAEFINENKEWDVASLSQIINMSDMNKITSILIPKTSIMEDTPNWNLNHKGNFSVKSSYDKLADTCISDMNWNWIWKLKVPSKLKGFLWTCMHGKILTNQQRRTRGLTACENCPRCNFNCEDMTHLFFTCPSSADIWSNIPSIQAPLTGDINAWRLWLQENVNHASVTKGVIQTQCLFWLRYGKSGLLETKKCLMTLILIRTVFIDSV